MSVLIFSLLVPQLPLVLKDRSL